MTVNLLQREDCGLSYQKIESVAGLSDSESHTLLIVRLAWSGYSIFHLVLPSHAKRCATVIRLLSAVLGHSAKQEYTLLRLAMKVARSVGGISS